jgi:hypothetical protein
VVLSSRGDKMGLPVAYELTTAMRRLGPAAQIEIYGSSLPVSGHPDYRPGPPANSTDVPKAEVQYPGLLPILAGGLTRRHSAPRSGRAAQRSLPS